MQLTTDLGNDRGMVTGLFEAARSAVDPAIAAFFGHRRRGPDVIDSHPTILFKVVMKMAPPGIFAALVIKLAKEIYKSPFLNV